MIPLFSYIFIALACKGIA